MSLGVLSQRAFAVLDRMPGMLSDAFQTAFMVPWALSQDSLDAADRVELISELAAFYHNRRWKGVIRRRDTNRRVS